ncbi:hypothetical protein [Nocardia altamirensis]|uniref:hypothetical protein n=1 Tax=Nocardia altamirensis TaxID=472158 RepID=UPI00114D0599|nr:hypothetical protein [Nocardia altamirensis]
MDTPPKVDSTSPAYSNSVSTQTSADVSAQQEQRRQKQYDALMSTSVPLDDEDDPSVVLAELRAIRKEVARERRG